MLNEGPSDEESRMNEIDGLLFGGLMNEGQ